MIRHLLRLFATSTLDGRHDCAQCGSLLDYSASARLLSELIGLVGDGMLSFDGTAVLSQLQKWHCKQCLGRMLGEKLSISCDVSTGSAQTSAGIFSTPSSSKQLEPRPHLNCVCWAFGYFMWVKGCPHHPVKNPFTLPIQIPYQKCEPPHGRCSEMDGPPEGNSIVVPIEGVNLKFLSHGDPGCDYAPYGRPTPDFVLEQNRRYMESK